METIFTRQPKYFKLEEFTYSRTAMENNLLNFPAARDQRCINQLARLVLDPIRHRFGKPIRVTSGFRCPALNVLVNGAKHSDHLTGCAADIVPLENSLDERKRLWAICRSMAQNHNIPVKQLINEQNFSWIHISIDLDLATQLPLGVARCQIIA